MEMATPLRRAMAYLLDAILFFLTLIIGYIIWWLIVLGRGQTPGKQLLGIRAVRRDGDSAGWGRMFVREVGKFALHTGTIGLIADGIFILIDENECRSIPDRVVDTVVIRIVPAGSLENAPLAAA